VIDSLVHKTPNIVEQTEVRAVERHIFGQMKVIKLFVI